MVATSKFNLWNLAPTSKTQKWIGLQQMAWTCLRILTNGLRICRPIKVQTKTPWYTSNNCSRLRDRNTIVSKEALVHQFLETIKKIFRRVLHIPILTRGQSRERILKRRSPMKVFTRSSKTVSLQAKEIQKKILTSVQLFQKKIVRTSPNFNSNSQKRSNRIVRT